MNSQHIIANPINIRMVCFGRRRGIYLMYSKLDIEKPVDYHIMSNFAIATLIDKRDTTSFHETLCQMLQLQRAVSLLYHTTSLHEMINSVILPLYLSRESMFVPIFVLWRH